MNHLVFKGVQVYCNGKNNERKRYLSCIQMHQLYCIKVLKGRGQEEWKTVHCVTVFSKDQKNLFELTGRILFSLLKLLSLKSLTLSDSALKNRIKLMLEKQRYFLLFHIFSFLVKIQGNVLNHQSESQGCYARTGLHSFSHSFSHFSYCLSSRAVLLNIWPVGQNRHTKGSNLAHWISLQSMKIAEK